jgi:hypothetical protein
VFIQQNVHVLLVTVCLSYFIAFNVEAGAGGELTNETTVNSYVTSRQSCGGGRCAGCFNRVDKVSDGTVRSLLMVLRYTNSWKVK